MIKALPCPPRILQICIETHPPICCALQANLGVARLLVRALQQVGIPEAQARAKMWLMDSKGLITKARTDLSPEKAEFAHDPKLLDASSGGGTGASGSKSLLNAVEMVRPTALIGAAAKQNAFTQPAVQALTQVRTCTVAHCNDVCIEMGDKAAEHMWHVTLHKAR